MKTDLLYKPIFCAMLMALPVLTSCQQQKTQVSEATPEAPKTSSSSSPVYPVKVSANHRYLVDQNNTPFLIVGDTPQGLISRLNEKEIDAFWAQMGNAVVQGSADAAAIIATIATSKVPRSTAAIPILSISGSHCTWVKKCSP